MPRQRTTTTAVRMRATIETPMLSEPHFVAPSSELPAEVISQVSHNNLDVEWHDGRLFFAFRTAPTHFASPDVAMYVVSTDDLASWRFEHSIALDTDVREPQLVSLGDRLLLYHAVLGRNSTDFEPMGTHLLEWQGPGSFGAPATVFAADFIPWRIKVEDGALRVSGYTGGGEIYDPDADPVRIFVLRSDDGSAWSPMFGGDGQVLEGGGSESDFAWLADGSLVAVVRNEAGDADGFGSKICTAPADSPGTWSCAADPKKYDSPLVLQQGDDIWLVARRNVSDTGWYDLMDDTLEPAQQYLAYQYDYWRKPKRCALWKVDPVARAVEYVLDLPSSGDTCFPEALRISETQFLLFNYTSPLDTDPSWMAGQEGPTSIYWLVLTLPR